MLVVQVQTSAAAPRVLVLMVYRAHRLVRSRRCSLLFVAMAKRGSLFAWSRVFVGVSPGFPASSGLHPLFGAAPEGRRPTSWKGLLGRCLSQWRLARQDNTDMLLGDAKKTADSLVVAVRQRFDQAFRASAVLVLMSFNHVFASLCGASVVRDRRMKKHIYAGRFSAWLGLA